MELLSRLSIRTKLASMVAFAALTVFAIIAVAASLSATRMQTDRVEQMRTAVDLLYGLAQSLQDDIAAGKMTQDEAFAEFRKRGHKMTFGDGQGYAVAYYPDTRLLINTGNPQVEGKITGAKIPTASPSPTPSLPPPGKAPLAALSPILTRDLARPYRCGRWPTLATLRRGTSS